MNRRSILSLVLIFFITLISILSSCSYWSGDAIIHLVYAENASHGRWFEFNVGEKSVGTTSIGWTYLMTFLLWMVGLKWSLIAQKLLLFVAVFALPIMVFLFLQRILGKSSIIPIFSALLVATNPGSAFNATLGMENVVFAFVVLVCLFSRFSILYSLDNSFKKSFLSGVLLGISTLLRPEGLILCGIMLLVAIYQIVYSKDKKSRLKHLVIGVIGAIIVLLLGFGFLYHHTGVMFGGASAQARVMQARLNSWQIIPGMLFLDPKVILRALAYLPLSLAVFFFPLILLKKENRTVWILKNEDFTVFTAIFIYVSASFALYAFVTGGAHLGRYMIPIIPCAAIILGLTLSVMQRVELFAGKKRKAVLAIVFLWFVGVYGLEWHLRHRHTGQQLSIGISELMNRANTKLRRNKTDEFLTRYGFSSNKSKLRVGVGCIEVQSRYEYDERINIISLDGRIWPVGTPQLYDKHGVIKGLKLINNFKPNIILEKPQYIRPGHQDLITKCFALKSGGSLSVSSDTLILRKDNFLEVKYAKKAH